MALTNDDLRSMANYLAFAYNWQMRTGRVDVFPAAEQEIVASVAANGIVEDEDDAIAGLRDAAVAYHAAANGDASEADLGLARRALLAAFWHYAMTSGHR